MAAEPEPYLSSTTLHPRLLLLAGPTAVGKSAIALRLAEERGGEIVSVDSMQVYRGLDIGTAKPSHADRARAPHHLIDVVDVTESFDAAQFVRLAHLAVADIQSRGRLPILCGGTGLYFKAFLEGLGQTPPADVSLRAVLEATPLPELLRELAERDPATYDRIDRRNPRRLIRAVEVIRLTGKPFSAQRAAGADGSRVVGDVAFSRLRDLCRYRRNDGGARVLPGAALVLCAAVTLPGTTALAMGAETAARERPGRDRRLHGVRDLRRSLAEC